jgi:hypothetical protein
VGRPLRGLYTFLAAAIFCASSRWSDDDSGQRAGFLDLFGRFGDALLEDVEGYVGFVLVDDEGWAEADAGLAAAENEEAALEGKVDYLIAHCAYWRAALLVFY